MLLWTLSREYYTLHGQILEVVDSAKYLGLTFSDDLSWNLHISKICAKANKTLGFLKRNLKIKNSNVKLTAYRSMVRPTLEFSSTVWHPKQTNLTQQLEAVQNRSARWITGLYSRDHSISKIKGDLNLPDLAHRRDISCLCIMFKIIHGYVLINPNEYFTMHRGGLYIRPIYYKTLYYGNSFFPSTIALWNTLPISVLQAPSIDAFKARLKRMQPPITN